LGAPQEPEQAFPLAGKPSGHTCSEQLLDYKHLCCGPWEELQGLRGASAHVVGPSQGCSPGWPGSACWYLPSSSAAADRGASTWVSTEAGLLGLCKRMSAPPSACLSSKENGSGLNQYQRLKISRLWSEGTTSNHLPSSF